MKNINIFLIFLTSIQFTNILNCSAEKIRYLSVEHPNITYKNHNYYSFFNTSARRYGRKSPIHYFEIHFESMISLDNRLMLDFYFFEWLTNAYKPSFVEMHFRWCDLIHKDNFFGVAMKQGNLAKPCPHPPGQYHLYNMTVPSAAIPPQFPFTKGRIYCNMTWEESKQKPKEWVGSGYIDMEIKIWNRKN